MRTWSGILLGPVLLETDVPDGVPKVVGFPRGERVLIRQDISTPSLAGDKNQEELKVLLESVLKGEPDAP